MFNMINSDFNRHRYAPLLLVTLCIFCAMAILSPYALGASTEWFDHHFLDHHHQIELDEEVLLFCMVVSIMMGFPLTKTGAQRHRFGSVHPIPQIPPPKHI
jgi:hypothetical protein